MLDDYFDKSLKYTSLDADGNKSILPYLKETGRFGISCRMQQDIHTKAAKIGKLLKSKRTGEKTVCIGTEEFSIETAIVVCELYRHGTEWKFSAIGSGFQGGLAALCNNYGLEVG